jgi:hypothetical protein
LGRTSTSGTARGPVERRVEVRHVDHEQAAQLFLGIRVRAILDASPVTQVDRGRGLGRLQASTADQDARVAEGLHVRQEAAVERLVSDRVDARGEIVGALVDQERVVHALFLSHQ